MLTLRVSLLVAVLFVVASNGCQASASVSTVHHSLPSVSTSLSAALTRVTGSKSGIACTTTEEEVTTDSTVTADTTTDKYGTRSRTKCVQKTSDDSSETYTVVTEVIYRKICTYSEYDEQLRSAAAAKRTTSASALRQVDVTENQCVTTESDVDADIWEGEFSYTHTQNVHVNVNCSVRESGREYDRQKRCKYTKTYSDESFSPSTDSYKSSTSSSVETDCFNEASDNYRTATRNKNSQMCVYTQSFVDGVANTEKDAKKLEKTAEMQSDYWYTETSQSLPATATTSDYWYTAEGGFTTTDGPDSPTVSVSTSKEVCTSGLIDVFDDMSASTSDTVVHSCETVSEYRLQSSVVLEAASEKQGQEEILRKAVMEESMKQLARNSAAIREKHDPRIQKEDA